MDPSIQTIKDHSTQQESKSKRSFVSFKKKAKAKSSSSSLDSFTHQAASTLPSNTIPYSKDVKLKQAAIKEGKL